MHTSIALPHSYFTAAHIIAAQSVSIPSLYVFASIILVGSFIRVPRKNPSKRNGKFRTAGKKKTPLQASKAMYDTQKMGRKIGKNLVVSRHFTPEESHIMYKMVGFPLLFAV